MSKIQATSLDYNIKNQTAIQKHSPKTDFTKATGIFAYQGRIPSSFFRILISPLFDNTKLGTVGGSNPFEFSTTKSFLHALDMYEDLGFYDPNYTPENDEDEEY